MANGHTDGLWTGEILADHRRNRVGGTVSLMGCKHNLWKLLA